jgi:hypothetical protein
MVRNTRIPVRYAAAIGLTGMEAPEHISLVSSLQFDAFARLTETEIDGLSIFAVCHQPAGINRISPGSSLNRIAVAFAKSGNLW